MRRRDFLLGTAAVVGSSTLLNPFGRVARAEGGGRCLVPWNSDTEMVSWPKAKEPPYKIALSNSYIGNSWRSEMVAIAKLYSQSKDVKPLIKELRVSSAGNNVSAQIAQLNQMILGGYDAIVVEAANPTGLNSTINRAVTAGIPVVSFDAVVTTDQAVLVNQGQFAMGKAWAEFIVEQMGNKGHVLMVRGVAGTSVDTQRVKGGMSVFSKYPGIETTEVYGKWDSGTAQKVTADALASSSTSFDGVWSQGGDDGIVRAFLQAGLDIPPIAGEAENGFRKQAAKYGFPMLSIGQSAALSAMSIKVALEMLQGHAVPQEIKVPTNKVTSAELAEGVNYFDDLPDSFFNSISIPACDLTFDAHSILDIMRS